jgi:uncharacterized protein YhfF
VQESCAGLWAEFLRSESEAAVATAAATYACWQFGHGVEQGDRLLAYVLSGSKRATTGALWTYEHEGLALPRPGEFSVVTDGSGVARCVLRTTSVSVLPFDQVDEGFAYVEGEGDRSLAYWRRVHWDYFVQELSSIGRVAAADMPVVCERFELVYRREGDGIELEAHPVPHVHEAGSEAPFLK